MHPFNIYINQQRAAEVAAQVQAEPRVMRLRQQQDTPAEAFHLPPEPPVRTPRAAEPLLATDAISSLRNGLSRVGLGTANIPVTERAETLLWHGGSLNYRYLAVQVGNETLQMSPDLVARNPEIAAAEISNLLGRPIGGSYT